MGFFARKAADLVSVSLKSGTLITMPLYSAAIKILNARKLPASVRRLNPEEDGIVNEAGGED